jgi:hypothetical protein
VMHQLGRWWLIGQTWGESSLSMPVVRGWQPWWWIHDRETAPYPPVSVTSPDGSESFSCLLLIWIRMMRHTNPHPCSLIIVRYISICCESDYYFTIRIYFHLSYFYVWSGKPTCHERTIVKPDSFLSYGLGVYRKLKSDHAS